MFEPVPIPFPTFAVSVSALLILFGIWLGFTRSRRRTGTEPRCRKCEYLLHGIESDRCPECGTVIDEKNIIRGRRRGRGIRVVTGLGLLALAFPISNGPLRRWSQSINWYQYKPTFLVMEDLQHGDWRPPPVDNPLERGITMGHGWLSEKVDLARVALDELLSRERLGKLAPAYRREINELALATQGVAFTTPVQFHLSQQLSDQLIHGNLTAAEEATFYQRAITVNLLSRPIIIDGDDVPISLRYQTALPGRQWGMTTTCTSVRIDGKPVSSSYAGPWTELPAEWASNHLTFRTDNDQRIGCVTTGRHRVDVDVLIEISRSIGDERVFHRETRSVGTTFEVTQLPADQIIQLLDAPQLADVLNDCIHLKGIDYQVYNGIIFSVFELRPSPVNFAFDVFVRFDGNDWPIGHIARAANTPLTELRLVSDYKHLRMPRPPSNVDIVLRASPKVALQTLDLYSIWNGELVVKDVYVPHGLVR